MARFTVDNGRFGPFETVFLNDTVTGTQAQLTLQGATLISYKVPLRDGLFDIHDGFESPEEVESMPMGKASIMAPWSNRIRDGVYTWDGDTHRAPINNEASHTAIHGFVREDFFEIMRESADDERVEVLLQCTSLREGQHAGYPFDVDVDVTYTLRKDRLMMTITGRNVGEKEAPFGCGWHPYFRTSEKGIDKLKLTIPAQEKVIIDESMIPLPGEAAYRNLDEVSEYDFRSGRIIGNQTMDAAFGGLKKDADGWCRTTLEDPESGVKITVMQERGLMHIFTGDRSSLAMEPVELPTNAYNRPACADKLRLKPGEERSFTFGVMAEQM